MPTPEGQNINFPGQGPETLTKTRTKTRLKVALVAGGILLAAAVLSVTTTFGTCKDTDGGKVFYKLGTVITNYFTYGYGWTSRSTTDRCLSDTTLREFFCLRNRRADIKYTCSNGCNRGACIVPKGEIKVSVDASNPQNRLVAGNSTNNTMAVFNFGAVNETVLIQKIQLRLSRSYSNGIDLSKVYIYDGSTLLASGTFPAVNGGPDNKLTLNLTAPLRIPANAPANANKIITIKADIASVGLFGPATAGHQITIDYLESWGIGESTGESIYNASFTQILTTAYLQRSLPYIAGSSLIASLNNGLQELGKFSVRADASGDIEVYKFTFKINVSNVKLSGLSLIDQGTGKTIYSGSASLPYGTTQVDAVLVSPLSIPAGTTKNIILKGTVSGAAVGSVISIVLDGDTGRNAVMQSAAEVDNSDTDNFIWSDMSKLSHNLSSADWTNGFVVSGLPGTGLPLSTLTSK